jgi:hypothetical protein
LLVLCACLALWPVPAAAQSVGPLPPIVFDIRGFYSGLGQDPVTASALGVAPTDLPARGLGGAAGIHVYPLRRARMAIGIGGEGILMRGRTERQTELGDPPALPIQQRLQGLSGSVSLNFGDRNGWSYVTAGMGPLVFKSYLGDEEPSAPAPSKMTINMGGGARWFVTEHVAVAFDVRFYLTRPEAIVEPYPGRQRARLLVLSGGVSFK